MSAKVAGTLTAEFAPEWEREREEKLRKRFRWYAWVVIGLNGLGVVGGVGLLVLAWVVGPGGSGEGGPVDVGGGGGIRSRFGMDATLSSQGWLLLFASGLTAGLFWWALRWVRESDPGRDRVILLVTWLILVGGVIGFLSNGVVMLVLSRTSPEAFLQAAGASGDFATLGINGAFGVMATHLFASLFLPWTARESIRPIWPLLYANVVLMAVVAWDRPGVVVVGAALAPLVAVPGTAVAWWKHSRFRDAVHNRALRKRYGDMKRELVDARRLHEDLFPEAIESGPLVMRYAYQPMRQIGGDYLYARTRTGADGEVTSAHVVVLDVTGHGVSAALTVNRIHGEIDRQLALHADLGPAGLLAALNEYLHLTVAQRSMYATALALRVDVAEGAVAWASAGHPPAFMRTVDGRLLHLHPTTIVLGAVPPENFERAEERLPFGAGDTILAYTDGATETRIGAGRMVRVQGLEGLVSALRFPRESPESVDASMEVASRLAEMRVGAVEDDTLIVQIARPLGRGAAVGRWRDGVAGAASG